MNRAINYYKTCPECGAPEANGLDCRGQLEEILAWEQADPELLSKHFWTVACFNIQHPSEFSEAAWSNFRGIFCEAFDSSLPIHEIGKMVSVLAAGPSKMKRKEAASPVYREWAMTVSEVYLGGEPKGAADRVFAWSKVVRKQLEVFE
ncbi:DUF5946 family protein [Bacillus sp. FJAT-27445]|uniref:DUF5946 family protein n=1 Tax=Bacillus sp. FJAT-27445 TaxID=1679166 RepID=UPI000743F2AF|nr:DUF5946 family protein [Bacillus sp. FJAT-27445]